MLTAAEARKEIDGEKAIFEHRAQVIADYLVDTLADAAAKALVRKRTHKVCASYGLKDAYYPAMVELGLEYLEPWMDGDEWDVLTARARKIANARIKDAGWKGRFYEKQHGDPIYAGGSGIYYTVELELELD